MLPNSDTQKKPNNQKFHSSGCVRDPCATYVYCLHGFRRFHGNKCVIDWGFSVIFLFIFDSASKWYWTNTDNIQMFRNSKVGLLWWMANDISIFFVSSPHPLSLFLSISVCFNFLLDWVSPLSLALSLPPSAPSIFSSLFCSYLLSVFSFFPSSFFKFFRLNSSLCHFPFRWPNIRIKCQCSNMSYQW